MFLKCTEITPFTLLSHEEFSSYEGSSPLCVWCVCLVCVQWHCWWLCMLICDPAQWPPGVLTPVLPSGSSLSLSSVPLFLKQLLPLQYTELVSKSNLRFFCEG